jgi:hypothetical protein
MNAHRNDIYEKARNCKRRTLKRCGSNPEAKRSCKQGRVGISRFNKRKLCSYILNSTAHQFEGYVSAKKFKEGATLQKKIGENIQQPFFTPLAVKESTQSRITDAAFLIYMRRLTTDSVTLYWQKGEWKAVWANWDEDTDIPFDDWKLVFPTQFDSFLQKAKQTGKQHIFLHMRQYKKFMERSGQPNESRHANFLHLDLGNKRLYRYEPSGYGLYEVFDMEELDERLSKWAVSKGLQYIPPYDSCPRQLISKLAIQQRMAGKAKREERDPGGFCKTWASFMLEQKLRNPDIPIVDLHDVAVKEFLTLNIDLTEFARYYTARVNQMGEAILKKHGMKDGQDPDAFLEKHWKKVMGA